MNKTKMQKGITLIALIITIIILLILAVVTIGSIKNSNIITYAQNASNDYEQAKEKEEGLLSNYEDKIKEHLNGKSAITWKDNGNGIFTSSNGITVEIGDYVDYKEGISTYTPDVTKGIGTKILSGNVTIGYELGTDKLTTQDLTWRVFGINKNGQLELISTEPTEQKVYLYGEKGYLDGVENLNELCNVLYGQGEYASGARSLNREDVNNLVNYDPREYIDEYSKYGDEFIWRYPTTSGNLQYSKDNGDSWINVEYPYNDTPFRLPGESKVIDINNPGTIKIDSNGYYYDIYDYLTIENDYTNRISDILTSGKAKNDYWLASQERYPGVASYKISYFIFGIGYMESGEVNTGEIIYQSHYDSTKPSLSEDSAKGIRAVVTLESDVKIITNDTANSVDNMWTLSK